MPLDNLGNPWKIQNNYMLINENDALINGEYQLNSQTTSIPLSWNFCGSQAFLSVRNTGTQYIHQMALSYNTGAIATRIYSKSTGKWTSWKLLSFQ